MPKISVAAAKAKGRELQKAVEKFLTEKFDLEQGDIVSRPMGSGGVDLMMSPAARRRLPFSIECKNTRRTPSHADLNQSRANAYPHTIPCVIWKGHRLSKNRMMLMFNAQEFFHFWRNYVLSGITETWNIDFDYEKDAGTNNRRRGPKKDLSKVHAPTPRKLTPDQVREIRRAYDSKELGLVELEQKHGVDRKTIYSVVKRQTYRNVKDEATKEEVPKAEETPSNQ